MQRWPTPTNLKVLRGCLGPTRYYRKFVEEYRVIEVQLTTLLRNNLFIWSKKALQAFNQLKQVMKNTTVIIVVDFS